MTTLDISESTTALSQTVERLVFTAATTPESLAHKEHAQWCRNCWQQVIDRTLIEWGRNPSAVEDEGVGCEPGGLDDRQGSGVGELVRAACHERAEDVVAVQLEVGAGAGVFPERRLFRGRRDLL